jgi:hypothetical protein
MRKQMTLLGLLISWAIPSWADDHRCITFSLDKEREEQIQIKIPEGWEKVSDRTTSDGYEIKFRDADGSRECSFGALRQNPKYRFTYSFEEPGQVVEMLFLGNRYLLPQHMLGRELWWFTSTIIVGDQASFRGMGLYPLNNYLFALTLKNHTSLQTLSDDAKTFILSVTVVPKASEAPIEQPVTKTLNNPEPPLLKASREIGIDETPDY